MNSIVNILGQLLFILLLIGINAFFAASEIAIISLNNSKIEKMAEGGNKKAQVLYKFVKEPSRFLATIQVGITLSGFLASASASQTFANMLSAWIIQLGLPLTPALANALSVALVVAVLTYVTLVLGELVPKRLAMQKYEGISGVVARPIEFLSVLTFPFVKLLTISTNYLVKMLGGNPEDNEKQITEEEIRIMVDVGEEKGVIRKAEKEMIENIFDFNDTVVSKVMTRRMDIVGISVDSTFDEVIKVIDEERFTRIPVYQGTIDNIIGILHVKDFIRFLNKGNKESFDLKKIIKPPYFVPESKKTDELFRELKQRKNHIAVVIDEFGGTAGIVTMEDLIEEIVGNIFDEYDEVIKEIEKIDDNTYLLDGSTRLDDIEDYFDIKLPVDEYETLSGFIIGQLGRIPDDSEKPEIEYEGIVLKIELIENKTISKVKVCKV